MNYKVIYRKQGKTEQLNIIAFNFSDVVQQVYKLGVAETSILAIILIDE
jgi:hypothetical protein